MAGKKVIQNAFEQVLESGRDMAKSSARQVKETFSPWEMIRNSFTDKENPSQDPSLKSKEKQGKGGSHTPLDFDKLNTSYADQDKQKIDLMKQRLFQLVKGDEEKTIQKGKREQAEKKQVEIQEVAEQQRRDMDKKRQDGLAAAPEGKSRGMKKRKKAAEPQPAETKPGSSKQ